MSEVINHPYNASLGHTSLYKMLFPSINHFDSTEVFASEGFEIVSTHGNVYTVRESDVSFVLCQTPRLSKSPFEKFLVSPLESDLRRSRSPSRLRRSRNKARFKRRA